MKTKTTLGVFDSGVGGFSVFKEIKKVTSVDIFYYGDCARAPYGNKSKEEITAYIEQTLKYLQSKGVTHFVSACNSMSVVTTNALLQKCGIRTGSYVDMTRAYSAYSIFFGTEVVLIIGTNATINSGTYQAILKNKGILFYEYAFPTLAQAIEEGADELKLLEIIKPALEYAQLVGVTHVLYGCTHYPLIHQVFIQAKVLTAWEGDYIDPALCVARAVEVWKLSGEKRCSFESSKETEVFKQMVLQSNIARRS